MSLQNLQAELADSILTNDSEIDLVKPATHICIYHNNIFTTLTQSLKETYPLIVQLLGEDFFQITAKIYIAQYPATSGDLHHYGEYFSDFLKEFSPVKNLAYLSEVAYFEWACHIAFFAADHAGFDLETLSNISSDDYPNLHFSLHPGSAVLHFNYPILQIMDLCHRHIDGPLNVDGVSLYLLITKRDDEVKLIPLEKADYIFLSSLQSDLSLKDALNAALLIDSTFELDTKLNRFIGDNIIVQVHLPHASR